MPGYALTDSSDSKPSMPDRQQVGAESRALLTLERTLCPGARLGNTHSSPRARATKRETAMIIDGQNKATPTGNRRTRRLWFTMHGLLALALVFSLPFVQADAAGLAGEMVAISAGSFSMGDLSGEGDDNEKPVHRVTVPAFRLGKHEVTFAQWDACVADGGCGGYRPGDMGWGRGNRPVINVSWDDAQLFIQWLNGKTGGGYRLPAESEWEYAVRAGTRTKYHFGNSISSGQANFDGNHDKTVPVGSYSANGWGLHDMHGNVREWVQDCWNEDYRGAPGDGSAWESGYCTAHVIRGGSWLNTAWDLRSADRGGYTRTGRNFYQGFRLARDK